MYLETISSKLTLYFNLHIYLSLEQTLSIFKSYNCPELGSYASPELRQVKPEHLFFSSHRTTPL